MSNRTEIVNFARGCIGTRFHHRGRLPGLGLDCPGLVFCAGIDAGLLPAGFDVEPYKLNPGGNIMVEKCDEIFDSIPQADMQPGDIIVIIANWHGQHMGILGDHLHGGLSIIHASGKERPPRVIETRLVLDQQQRFVKAYKYRGID